MSTSPGGREAADASVAAHYWDKADRVYSRCWIGNEAVQSRLWHRVTGKPDVNPVHWFLEKYGPFRAVAGIGCGLGNLERFVAYDPLSQGTETIVGYDISPATIEEARKINVDVPRVHFHVADLNTFCWPRNTYDAVAANGALHHIAKLDFLFEQVSNALTDDGYLYVNDYVGPQRFQFSDVQLRLAAEMLDSIPSRWVQKPAPIRCDPVKLQETDPSEGVQSHFVRDTLKVHFEIVECIENGGTLLAPIFGSDCLNPEILASEEGLECVSMMAKRELEMIDQGLLPSDHVVIVARKRSKRVTARVEAR